MLYSDITLPELSYENMAARILKAGVDVVTPVPDLYQDSNEYVRGDLVVELLDTIPLTNNDIMVAHNERGNSFVIAVTKYDSDGKALDTETIKEHLMNGLRLYWNHYNAVGYDIDKE